MAHSYIRVNDLRDYRKLRYDVTPLYYQVLTVLRNQIGTTWKKGDLIPPEHALAREFGTSVGTVRRALELLEREGLLERRHGVGNRVRRPMPGSEEQRLSGSLKDLMQFGRQARVRLLSRSTIVPPQAALEALQLDEGQKVTFIRRVVYVKGLPLALLRTYFLVQYDSAIADSDLNALPMVVLLEQKCGVKLARGEQTIQAKASGVDTGKALRIPLGFPLLAVTRKYYDQDGHPVLYTAGEYRADRYQCVVSLEPGRGL